MNWFDFDPKYVKICVYAALTTLVTMALCLLMMNSGGVFSKAWELIAAVVEPFVYGMLMCYLLLPTVRKITDWLQAHRIFPNNLKRRLQIATTITVLSVALIVLGVVFVLVLVITRSVDSVNLQTIQQLWSSAEGDIMGLIGVFRNWAQQLGIISGDQPSTIIGTFGEVTGLFSKAVFSIVFGVYFLLDGARVFQYAKRVFVAAFGEYLGPDLTVFLNDADAAFSGYIRGQFVDALIIGVITAVTFTLIGIPYGPIIGLLTGFGNLIPYVGGPVGYATTVLVCLAEGDVTRLIEGVLALSVIMFLDANVLNPRLLSNAVEVHPLVVIIALIAGSAVGGLAGMLIAVPSAAFIKVQLERWLVKRESALAGARFRERTGSFVRDVESVEDLPIDEPDDL